MYSCIQVEILFGPYTLPVHGRHLLVPLTLMSAIIQTSPTVLFDLENIGITVIISMLSFILAKIYVISSLLPVAAIFDLRHIKTSNIIPTSLPVLPDPNIMVIS